MFQLKDININNDWDQTNLCHNKYCNVMVLNLVCNLFLKTSITKITTKTKYLRR